MLITIQDTGTTEMRRFIVEKIKTGLRIIDSIKKPFLDTSQVILRQKCDDIRTISSKKTMKWYPLDGPFLYNILDNDPS